MARGDSDEPIRPLQCFLCRYEDGGMTCPSHRHSCRQLTLSLGASRKMRIGSRDVLLRHGDVVMLNGETHALLGGGGSVGLRISINLFYTLEAEHTNATINSTPRSNLVRSTQPLCVPTSATLGRAPIQVPLGKAPARQRVRRAPAFGEQGSLRGGRGEDTHLPAAAEHISPTQCAAVTQDERHSLPSVPETAAQKSTPPALAVLPPAAVQVAAHVQSIGGRVGQTGTWETRKVPAASARKGSMGDGGLLSPTGGSSKPGHANDGPLRVCVVGGGPAGLGCCKRLCEHPGFLVTMVVEGRGIGGRMCTKYPNGRDDPSLAFDFGVQRIQLRGNLLADLEACALEAGTDLVAAWPAPGKLSRLTFTADGSATAQPQASAGSVVGYPSFGVLGRALVTSCETLEVHGDRTARVTRRDPRTGRWCVEWGRAAPTGGQARTREDLRGAVEVRMRRQRSAAIGQQPAASGQQLGR